MQKYGAIYGAFTGGAAVLAAKAVKRIRAVEWLDLGMPEALWIFDAQEFGPLTVAIDSYGNNLFKDVKERTERKKKSIYERLGV
jgi:fumarate hydratase subunit beta